MTKIPYSVEFCHIYTDESANDEQAGSIEVTKEKLADLGAGYTTTVLIDDEHPDEHSLDVPDFLKRLEHHEVAADFWAFESELAAYQKEFLALITNQRVRSSYGRYIESKDKLPCSFLTAIWYFLRLGKLQDASHVIKPNNGKVFVPADKLLNVLPLRFSTAEKQTTKLLQATNIPKIVDDIETVFFEPNRGTHFQQTSRS